VLPRQRDAQTGLVTRLVKVDQYPKG